MEQATIRGRFRPRNEGSGHSERRGATSDGRVRALERVETLGRMHAGGRRSSTRRTRWTATKEGARRSLNVLVALLGLVLSAPLMILIAILVKLTSKGPVLYTQPRVGLDRRSGRSRTENGDRCRRSEDRGGRLFTMYKFRTMYVGADREGEVWARPEDPRVTPLGRILRKYRLDELPQLFNVLKGDMNVVGPRPEQPTIFQGLREKVDGYAQRQKVLPGITGLAQIRQSYDQSLDDVKTKVELDLDYMARRSPAEDVRIMLETIPVMLNKKGSI